MNNALEISFNSPQCGWMSIGFTDGASEFNTTTAHAPYRGVLGDLMTILTEMKRGGGPLERTLKWNRDPEEFDFHFSSSDDKAIIQIYEYPTDERDSSERKLVFSHEGTVASVCAAFGETFDQLYADRETDEFEVNWRQPFPYDEFREFKSVMS